MARLVADPDANANFAALLVAKLHSWWGLQLSALALTGAILGHANLRSTAIYAHVQRDPSLEVAKRVEKLLATALERKAVEKNEDETTKASPEMDADLIRVLAERLSKEDSDAARLRAILAQVIALNT